MQHSLLCPCKHFAHFGFQDINLLCPTLKTNKGLKNLEKKTPINVGITQSKIEISN